MQLLYPREEIDNFFYLLLEHYLGANRFVLVLDPERRISREEEAPFFEALGKLKREYPIQYIIGRVTFIDLTLRVNEQVLIPRPETEELVRWIIDDHAREARNPKILDIGTGSGCIALSLSKALPGATVRATDNSGEALEIAKANARDNGLQVAFHREDICHATPPGTPWDIIVSNPPYVRESEKEGMRNNVKVYEPAKALFVADENPLRYYRCIAAYAARYLTEEGLLYLEINQYLGTETCRLLEGMLFREIELRKDAFGNDRMVKARACRQKSK